MVEYIKPANQLELSTSELDEDFARNLNAARPGPPRVILRYNLEEKMYKPEPQLEQVTLQYSTEGCLVWRDSEEGHKVVKAKALVDELEAKSVRRSIAISSAALISGRLSYRSERFLPEAKPPITTLLEGNAGSDDFCEWMPYR